MNHHVYRPIGVSVDVSVDTSVDTRSRIDRYSIEYRPIHDRVTIDVSTDTSADTSVAVPYKIHDPSSLASNTCSANSFTFYFRAPTMEEVFEGEPRIGGHDFVFVDELSSGQTCSICLLAMRSPVQTVCGHRFCESCLLKTFRYY